MSKEQVADQHSYANSIEENSRQYGYKAANLINLQDIVKEFNECKQAASLARLYGEIDVKIPEFQALSADIIQAHLDAHAPNWRELFNDFKISFEAQENQNTLLDIAVQKLEELQQVIITCFRDHPLSDEIIALFLNKTILMISNY